MRRSVGCEAVLLGVQASIGHDTPYVGPVRLPVCHVQIAKATDACGELRNGNSGLHGAPQCLVVGIVAHVFMERITRYWWPLGLGTRQYDFTKAACACGTLRIAREGATLSSETGNGEGNYYFFSWLSKV